MATGFGQTVIRLARLQHILIGHQVNQATALVMILPAQWPMCTTYMVSGALAAVNDRGVLLLALSVKKNQIFNDGNCLMQCVHFYDR